MALTHRRPPAESSAKEPRASVNRPGRALFGVINFAVWIFALAQFPLGTASFLLAHWVNSWSGVLSSIGTLLWWYDWEALWFSVALLLFVIHAGISEDFVPQPNIWLGDTE